MKILMMLMILAPAMVQAELIQNNDRDIYDLMWLPRKGIFFGSTEVNFEDRNYEISGNGNPGKVIEADRKLIQTIGHSFTDRLSLSFETNYLFRRKITFTPDVGSETITEDKGLGDPAVSLRWRVLDQSKNKFTLDLIPRLSYSTGEFRLGTGTREGNNQTGRSTFGARLEAGKKYTQVQWMTYLGYTQLDEAQGDADTKNSAYSSYQAGLKVLGPIETGFYLYGGINYSQDSANKYSNNAGTFLKMPAVSKGTFEGGLTYLPDPDIALTGSFQLGKISNNTREDATASKVKYNNGSITIFSLLARYQF